MTDPIETTAAAPTTLPAADSPNPLPQTPSDDVPPAIPPKDDEIQKVPVPPKDKVAAAPTKGAAAASPAPSTPLAKLFTELKAITKDADYKEMWGIELQDDKHVPTTIVLQKFLRANNNDVGKAKTQLGNALK